MGTTSSSTSIQFSAVLVAESSAISPLHLQVEVRPNGTPFTSQLTHESLEVTTGQTATVEFTGLPNTNYHWRARSIDAAGRTSPWISFGNNADGIIDLRIDSAAVGAGGSNQVFNNVEQDKKDKCGLTGLEVFAVLGLLAAARRIRKS